MQARRNAAIFTVALAGAAALFWSATGAARNQTGASHTVHARVTFYRDIAPLVFRTCAPCHHPGESAPFSLLSYGDVKSHARQNAYTVQKRIMPPWLPGPSDYAFVGDDRLNDAEIALFQKWVDDGLLEGDPHDAPAAPQFASGWQLGKPDVVLTAPKAYTLPASGSDQYWNFVFRPQLKESRWVKAVEIHPAQKRLVHHANLLVDRWQSGRREEKSPGAGFAGMELQIESESFDPDGHFFFWKPGMILKPEPADMALRLDAGNDLVLNTHLQPSGKSEPIQPSIGIYFTNEPAKRFPVLMQLENDAALHIPAGEASFVVTDEFTLPGEVELLAIYPHAHYVCREMFALATFPDRSTKTLLHIPRWDQNWQSVFRYAHPVQLPGGTKITMRYIYDNSAGNPQNPNHPPKLVRGGNQSTDEMAHLWLQVLPLARGEKGSNGRIELLEALAWHHVQNDPEDFSARYNLAALLQMRGEIGAAIAQYRQALRLQPGDAVAENALGGALLAMGNVSEAIPHLRTAAKARADYFDAHYNLGNALASAEDYAGAAMEFGEAARIRPEDADAEANWGGALAMLGKNVEAQQHLERALQINPKHQLARENLEAIRKGQN